jgi:hypothetical protein
MTGFMIAQKRNPYQIPAGVVFTTSPGQGRALAGPWLSRRPDTAHRFSALAGDREGEAAA